MELKDDSIYNGAAGMTREEREEVLEKMIQRHLWWKRTGIPTILVSIILLGLIIASAG